MRRMPMIVSAPRTKTLLPAISWIVKGAGLERLAGVRWEEEREVVGGAPAVEEAHERLALLFVVAAAPVGFVERVEEEPGRAEVGEQLFHSLDVRAVVVEREPFGDADVADEVGV